MENEKKEQIDSNKEIKDSIKKCIKCGNIMGENNKYCTVCGTNNDIMIKPKKEKESRKPKTYQLVILSSLITLVLTLGLCYGLIRYLNENEVTINTGNKNVTIHDTGIADAVDKVYDSVVVVENHIGGQVQATGSGFVYESDDKYGYILTNSHVLTNATEAYVAFTDNEKVNAELVGIDEFSDVAVLKVAKKHIKQVAIMGKNNDMRVGDTTFAIGAPLDSTTYSWSVTRGILSGKDRLVSSGTSYMTVLQTDTPINSGNSGGPLCNANGEVIGITNMKLASDQIEGMGFAIPIEIALEYADQYVSGKDVRRPYIGVAIYDSMTSFFSQESYVVVESVEQGSPAEKAGIKAGDIIIEIDGEKVENSSYFKYKLYSHKIGEEVKIKVQRGNKDKAFTVKLESNSKKA